MFTPSYSRILTQVNVATIRGEQWEDPTALWDTGSESSGISQELASRLGLKPKAWGDVRYGNGAIQTEPIYVVRLRFPLTGHMAILEVKGFEDTAQDAIIGMDIISHGRFLLEPTEDGGARFTFSI